MAVTYKFYTFTSSNNKRNERTIKKLRDRIKGQKRIASGLCLETKFMRDDNRITKDECDAMLNYIHKHRPKKGKHFVPYNNSSNYGYFWESELVAPRLAWLNDQIKNFHNDR